MSSIIRRDKSLGPEELVNVATFASIPITEKADITNECNSTKGKKMKRKDFLCVEKHIIKAIRSTRKVLLAWNLDCSPSDKILHIARFCKPVFIDRDTVNSK